MDADNPTFVVAKHEITHRLKETAPEQYDKFEKYVMQSMDPDEFQSKVERLEDLYRANNLEIDIETIIEEIVCDFTEEIFIDEGAFNKIMNHDRTLAEILLELLQELIAKLRGAAIEVDTQLTEAERLWMEMLRGDKARKDVSGKERFSLRKAFPKEFDEWMESKTAKQRRKDGGGFLIGTTSDALQSIGVEDYNIFWKKAKVQKIMDDHSEMSPETMKNVPKLLENPIIVLQSQTRVNSIVIFGEMFGTNGEPVMVAVQLNPKDKNGQILDYIIVASAYGRPNNQVQSLIDMSDILYIDPNKNRTDAWLSALRVQFPSAITKYGSIDNVTYYDETVNNVPQKTSIFGNVFGENGYPVMAAVRLDPKGAKGQVLDFAVIMSAYGRPNEQAKYLIETSDILYIDPNKKRTNSWAESLRVQFPSEITQYGSIGRVTYYDETVNNVPQKTSMQEAFDKAQNDNKKFSLKGQSSMNKSYKRMEEMNEMLKAQMKLSDRTEVDSKKTAEYAVEVIKSTGSTIDKKTVADKLGALYKKMGATEVDYNDIKWDA